MDKRRVIKYSALPSKPPTIPTLVAWLLLDRFEAPGIVWGIVGTIMVLIWLSFFVAFFHTEQTVEPVFKDEGPKA